MSDRGQTFSFDLVVALGIATLAWGFLAFGFHQAELRSAERAQQTALGLQAAQLTELLVLTPGIPDAWERSPSRNVTIGLASSPHTISSAKFAAFTGMEIDDAKEALNLPPRRFNITIKTTNGSVRVSYGDLDPGRNRTRIVSSRPIIYNGSAHIMEFAVQE